MKAYLFPSESSPTRLHRFLLPLELEVLGRLLGTPIEHIGILTLESNKTTTINPLATEGGILIPLHGCVSLHSHDGSRLVEVLVPVSTHEGPFRGFVVDHREPITVVNRSSDKAYVLCVSGNAFALLEGTVRGITRTQLIALFSKDPKWIYVNNMSPLSGPSGNHYHGRGHEYGLPVHGTFAVTLEHKETHETAEYLLDSDQIFHDRPGLHIPPNTAHAVYVYDRRVPLSRLLIISTARPRTEDTYEYFVVAPS